MASGLPSSGMPVRGRGRYNSFDNTSRSSKMPFIDYILVYKSAAALAAQSTSPEQSSRNAHMESLRTIFEKHLQEEGFEINRELYGDNVYVALECPFWRLANEAERVHLEMPLKDKKLKGDKPSCGNLLRLVGYQEEDDEICIDFEVSKGHLFENYNSPDRFFRQSLRSMLVHIILTEIDVSQAFNDECLDEENRIASMCGLPQLLHRGVYTDAFVLHDPSFKDGSAAVSFGSTGRLEEVGSGKPSEVDHHEASSDERRSLCPSMDYRTGLDRRWPNVLRVQPMSLIREYFGEEIALYFAWSGLLSFSVFLPSLFGLAIFFYGLHLSVSSNASNAGLTGMVADTSAHKNITIPVSYTMTTIYMSTTTMLPNSTTAFSFPDVLKTYAESALTTIQAALDNDITPWYSLVICIWGTLFLELWKRRNAVLAYEWDVEHFESNEPDRPEFEGEIKKDIITGEVIKHYSAHKKFFKYVISVTVFLLMVCVVLIISVSVITYRIFLRIDYCTITGISSNGTSINGTTRWNVLTCTVVTSFGATVLNAIAIMILGKIYDMLAVKLTDWENHKTETDYRDALIVKLFAFAFANSYTSLFYIAFFQNDQVYGDNGLFGRGWPYRETCNASCMSTLSLQVLVLIIMKPIPKLLTDIIIPAVKKLIAKVKDRTGWQPYLAPNKDALLEYIVKESQKPMLGEFTLSEYTEKVIQYGYLMLFAVSMPLAPLIVLLTNVADRYVDAKRMLWWYRRPVAKIAQDIGVWYYILQFLNVSGVITNAFLIAFTSKWGRSYLQDVESRLAFGLIFEHVVFALKFLLALAIPDIPGSVKDSIRRKHFLVKALLKSEQPTGKSRREPFDGGGRISQLLNSSGIARRIGSQALDDKNFSVTEV